MHLTGPLYPNVFKFLDVRNIFRDLLKMHLSSFFLHLMCGNPAPAILWQDKWGHNGRVMKVSGCLDGYQ